MRRTRCATAAALAVLIGAAGCVHSDHYRGEGPPHIAVPPPGAVPRELEKIVLPEYVIEAPDSLSIEVVIKSPEKDKDGKLTGKVTTELLPVQPINATQGGFIVRHDGTVSLGFWGNVPVAGLPLGQAAEAVRQHVLSNQVIRDLGTKAENLVVIMDVLAYNSKFYYIITDNAGNGEQAQRFPITGSDTVLDAMCNIGGIPPVGSKRNIWVARRTPHAGQHWQILPVDWVGMTQHGITVTNYQILPGDRIYVKAQRLITIDNTMAKILNPIERLFGITLLGSSTVNQIGGRGAGFNNTGN